MGSCLVVWCCFGVLMCAQIVNAVVFIVPDKKSFFLGSYLSFLDKIDVI